MEASARRETVPTIWRIPDDLWLIVRHVLPPAELRRSRGRPWIDSRRIVDGVLYVLRTGCQWKAVPREYGSGSTVHRRFQRWVEEAPRELADRILLSSLALSLAGVSEVIWKSPLPAENYYEYRDDFLVPLRLEQHEEVGVRNRTRTANRTRGALPFTPSSEPRCSPNLPGSAVGASRSVSPIFGGLPIPLAAGLSGCNRAE